MCHLCQDGTRAAGSGASGALPGWSAHGGRGRGHGGPLLVTKAMDYITKWPEAYAIPDQEATTLAGEPLDQGQNLKTAVFQEC